MGAHNGCMLVFWVLCEVGFGLVSIGVGVGARVRIVCF